MDEWHEADQEAFARSVLRRRWLSALGRSGVRTVGELRAMSEEQVRRIPNFGPKTIADISTALADRTLRPDDPLERLALATAQAMSERDGELVRMRQSGATLAAIARRFGISRARVVQIVERDGW